jgi:hypothetical protein
MTYLINAGCYNNLDEEDYDDSIYPKTAGSDAILDNDKNVMNMEARG